MGFLPNFEQIALDKIKAIDSNHNKRPDALEALEAIKAGAKRLEALLSRLDLADFLVLLHAFNGLVNKKLSEAEIQEFANSAVQIASGLEVVQVIAGEAEKKLGG